jgi:SAM-dependent methyltransferase
MIVPAWIAQPPIWFWMKLDARAGRFAKTLVQWTGKSDQPLHPKHLVPSEEHCWYLPEIGEGSLVLDIGCNAGAHAIACAKVGARVVGVDLDLGELRVARNLVRRQGLETVGLCVSQCETNWPLRDRSFDVVLILDVLEHLVARGAALAETHRVLKDNGRLLVSIPNRDTSWKRLRRRLGLFDLADPDHKIEYTLDEAIAEVRSGGFELVGEPAPVVVDTPVAGLIDLVGGFSLGWYGRLTRWKRDEAGRHPGESSGFRFLLRKVERHDAE